MPNFAAVISSVMVSVAVAGAATVNVSSTVRGSTPQYMGFNPGGGGGYEDGSILGS